MAKGEVLVVDDSATVRIQARFILQRIPLAVTEASSADEALEILKTRTFDIILTDLTMPGIDGLEFIRLVRGLQHADRTPIVVMTSRSAEEDVEEAFVRGASAFVVKPVVEKNLREVIERQLAASRL